MAMHMAVNVGPLSRLNGNGSAAGSFVFDPEHTACPPVADVAAVGSGQVQPVVKSATARVWIAAIPKGRGIGLKVFYGKGGLSPQSRNGGVSTAQLLGIGRNPRTMESNAGP